jgi:hypothetical protein
MNTNDATGGYLGAPLDGVTLYCVQVGHYLLGYGEAMSWEAAQQLAEDYMAYDTYVDVEIVAAAYVKAPKYIEQANRSVQLYREQLAAYAQNYQPAPETESTCGTELHQALESTYPSPPPSR